MTMYEQNVKTGNRASNEDAPTGVAGKTQEAAENIKETLLDQANHVRDRAESAKQHTVDRIRGVATQFRGMSDTLRTDDPFTAGLVERTSKGIEGLATYVNAASPQSFVRDTEELARRQPALFFGGAFLLGLAAGRFLKSPRAEGDFPTSMNTTRPSYDEPKARAQERPSGFAPARSASVGTPERVRENSDAVFGRDMDEPQRDSGAKQGTYGATGSDAKSPPRGRDKNGGSVTGSGKGSQP